EDFDRFVPIQIVELAARLQSSVDQDRFLTDRFASHWITRDRRPECTNGAAARPACGDDQRTGDVRAGRDYVPGSKPYRQGNRLAVCRLAIRNAHNAANAVLELADVEA